MKRQRKQQLDEIQAKIDNYDLDDAIVDLINLANETWNEEITQDFIDQYTAEEMAKNELETGWLARLYFFMWNVNFNACWDYIRLDWYWNCEEIDKRDVEIALEELTDALEED